MVLNVWVLNWNLYKYHHHHQIPYYKWGIFTQFQLTSPIHFLLNKHMTYVYALFARIHYFLIFVYIYLCFSVESVSLFNQILWHSLTHSFKIHRINSLHVCKVLRTQQLKQMKTNELILMHSVPFTQKKIWCSLVRAFEDSRVISEKKFHKFFSTTTI